MTILDINAENEKLKSVLNVTRSIHRLISQGKNINDFSRKIVSLLVENDSFFKVHLILIKDRFSKYSIVYTAHQDSNEITTKTKNINNINSVNCLQNKHFFITNHPDSKCCSCPLSEGREKGRTFTTVLKHHDKNFGYLIAYPENKEFLDLEVDLFKELSEDIALAMHAFKEEEKSRHYQKKLNIAQKIARMGSYTFYPEDNTWGSSTTYDEIVGIDNTYKKDFQGWLNFIHPDFKNKLKQSFSASVSKDKNLLFKHKANYKIINQKSNKECWIEDVAEYHYDQNNKLERIEGVITDITEVKKAENERITLRNQLDQSRKMETIGTLAGGIAHDFNNILTPILGYADMLQQHLADDSEAREGLNRIAEGALRAKELVDQILTFSRQSVKELKALKIHLILKEALKLIRSSLPSSIVIKKNICTDCFNVLADPTQIHQIFMNLCTNAFQAMSNEKGVLEIYLKNVNHSELPLFYQNILDKRSYVVLTVKDNGQGMSKDIQEKIFDPFFTTKEQGKGTGLGLSTVYGIIKSYGGEIFVNSELGLGTTFNLYFPALENFSENNCSAQEKKSAVKGAGQKILVLDDEQSVLVMFKRLLQMLNYKVKVYSKSEEAIKALESEDFDLLITDLTMPVLSGLDVISRIRRDQNKIPVFLITGYRDKVDEKLKEELGIKKIISKPVTMKFMADTLKDFFASAMNKPNNEEYASEIIN